MLGSLPLELGIREQGDAGVPIVSARPESATAHAYKSAARRLSIALSRRPPVATPLSVSLLSP
jgi:ATP-binding protein involved in chromosome partitioning